MSVPTVVRTSPAFYTVGVYAFARWITAFCLNIHNQKQAQKKHTSTAKATNMLLQLQVLYCCVLVQVYVVQVDVQSLGDVEELQGMLGLALHLDTGGKDWQAAPAPHVPCEAPFSSMLPDIMRLAHRSAHNACS